MAEWWDCDDAGVDVAALVSVPDGWDEATATGGWREELGKGEMMKRMQVKKLTRIKVL